MSETSVTPAYARDQIVCYVDSHQRVQTGRVLSIEARWSRAYGPTPLVTYTVAHPSYRNNRTTVTARDIRYAMEKAA